METNGKGPKDFGDGDDNRWRQHVTFEDGHEETFEANNLLVTNVGGLILSQHEVKKVRQFTANGWQEGMQVVQEVRAVLAHPRADKLARENWQRVRSEHIVDEPDVLKLPATAGQEAN